MDPQKIRLFKLMVSEQFISKSKWKSRPGLVDLSYSQGYCMLLDNDIVDFYNHYNEDIK